jgi:biopolymer transport protein TolR
VAALTSGGERDSLGSLSEINVTPLVDVMLVLLIIFMVTAPMMQRSVDVRLPRVEGGTDTRQQRTIVTVDRRNRLYLAGFLLSRRFFPKGRVYLLLNNIFY